LRRDQEAASRPGAYETQYRLRAADGSMVWVRDVVTVRADRVTGVRRVRGVMINITRQRQAEVEREEAFQRIDRRSQPAEVRPPRAPAATPPEERILIQAGTTLGTSLEPEVIARNLAGLVVPQLADWSLVLLTGEGKLRCAALAHRDPAKAAAREEFDRLLDQPGGVPFRVGTLLDGGKGHVFADLPGEAFPDGAVRPELLRLLRGLGAASALTAPLPGRTGVFGALVCVSASPAHRYGERDLALAQELGRRAALALENARLFRDAHSAVRRREEFLSIAAHELMTPVASLLLTVQTILEALDQQPLDLEFVRGRAVAGERQGVRLGRLVNELLDVSRIRAGRLELVRAEMDLAAALHAVVGRFRDEVTRKEIDVAVHAPAPARGHWDQSRIEQIISNLLSNAIKYGDRQPVLVTLSQDRDKVTLEVADRGIGMDPGFLPRLFNPFERGVSAGHYGGLGLGLYIAAQNAEAHGGKISVCSVPGQGSTFTVELPRRAPSPAPTG
jgi:signal transduction histidine kinase